MLLLPDNTGEKEAWMRLLSLVLLLFLCIVGVSQNAWSQPGATPTSSGLPVCTPDSAFSTDSKNGLAAGWAAMCAAEGNCDSNGNPTANYTGHYDPIGKTHNKGFCSSLQGDQECFQRLGPHVRNAASMAQSAGFKPEENMEVFTNIVDLLNQYTGGAERFTAELKNKIQEKGGVKNITSDDIYNIRMKVLPDITAKSYLPSMGRDQLRRVSALHSVLSMRKNNCSGSGGLSIGNNIQNAVGGAVGGLEQAQQKILDDIEKSLSKVIECWSCDLIKGVVTVSAKLGFPAFQIFSTGLITLIGLVTGIMLLWNAGKLLMPFAPLEGGRKVLNNVVVMTGMALFTIGALQSLNFVWKYIYTPTLSASLNLSDAVMAAGGNNTSAGCASGSFTSNTMEGQSKELGERLSCRVRGISQQINNGMRIGWAMLASINSSPDYLMSNAGLNPASAAKKIFMRLVLGISGITLIILFLYASSAFLFAIVDVIIRWSFIFVLSPLMVAAFTFRETRSFATFGFRGLAEAMLTLTLMSIVATISSLLITELGTDPSDASGTAPDIEKFIMGVQQGVQVAPTINTPQFGKMFIIGLLAGSLIFKIKHVSQTLVGGGLAIAMEGASVLGKQFLDSRFAGLASNLKDNTIGRIGSNLAGTHLNNRLAQEMGRVAAMGRTWVTGP
jgi:hypothetical protein